uniref:Structural maintenance of chromosomes protein n=1 Tax=Cyclopterus lumpus TaxID=8103 RepID=A0A8C3A122_CYCLU
NPNLPTAETAPLRSDIQRHAEGFQHVSEYLPPPPPPPSSTLGKSNVMDALSFATGERVASLRVKHLRDLVHGAHIGRPVRDTARVALRCCDDEDQETVFSRSILGDSSQYRIDDVQVTLTKYIEELEKIDIVTKARNCLVFQGAVESIALKDPKERTKMFECISQSREYAAEYEMKKKALLNAKEDTQFHFNKKKSATVERKQVSQEKIEAQKYQTLLDNLHQNRLQLSLAELFCNEKGINVLSDILREKQLAAAAKNNTLVKEEQTVKTYKKEHGRLTREQQHIEKEIRAQEHVLSQCRSQYIKARVNTSHHMKKAGEVRDALRKSQKLIAIKEQELAEERQEISELERTWRNYEKEQKKKGASLKRDIQLDEDQVKLKELARKQGAVLGQQLLIEFNDYLSMKKILYLLNSRRNIPEWNPSKLLQSHRVCFRSSLEEYRQLEESLSAELQRGRQRSEELKQELGQVMEELGNAHLDSQESRCQQRRNELLDRLRSLFPETVFGRLSDLCSPVHKKYQLAVIKVFGRFMNAIVVSSEKVARECISFIKEERAERETFLPIDYLDMSPMNERLREMPGAKMVVDVVQVNNATGSAQLRKVVQFVCGNALVCETIKEARSVAFDGQVRLKTVALDGTLFTKAGVISGGSSSLRTKARCWDEKDMMRLKARKDQLTDLMKLKRKDSDLKQTIAQAQGAKTRLKYSNADLDNIQKKNIPHCQAVQNRDSFEHYHDYQCSFGRWIRAPNHMRCTRLRHRKLTSPMEDTVFFDFCAEIGVDCIREYEQEHLKQQTELDRKRYEKNTTHGGVFIDLLPVEDGQKKQLEENITFQSTFGFQFSLPDLPHRELVKLQREVMSAESALEQKRLARHNMLLACKIQGLPIILLSGNLDEISEMQLDTESESTSTTLNIFEREARLLIDYSGLDAELTVETSRLIISSQCRLESVSSVEGVLHRTTAPNLKALAKMRESHWFPVPCSAFEASTKAARKCNQEFEQVKDRRLNLFNRCFEHVCVVIDQIYKRICRNNSAQAILSAENPEEPYLGGINYNCVAPGKRFMSMDNLSGGEKAIAALALVFAIHSFRPAPFFILDEVDAALDNTNIGKVTSFIREQSRENMQIIVISLKEEFFSKADALLGVYSDFEECMFSRILTLDLRPYPLVDEDSERQADVEKTGLV